MEWHRIKNSWNNPRKEQSRRTLSVQCHHVASPCSYRKSILNVHWKDWCWSSNNLATWCEQLTHWKRPWCWERLKAGREGDSRGWDGWVASLTWWTWVWASSGSWWWTGRPGVLQSMGLQRVGHDWAPELNWCSYRTSLVAQVVKNLPAMQETQFDPWIGMIPLEKGMATYSSMLSWRIPWTEELDRLQYVGSQRAGRDRVTSLSSCRYNDWDNVVLERDR